MSAEVKAEIRGLQETQRKLEQVVQDLDGGPMLMAMRTATLMVERDAKQFAPVDTGRLRASLTPQIINTATAIEGVVGSNVTYAPYMELGTKPHFPPIDALATWVHHKRFASGDPVEERRIAFVIARKIARSGLKARKFLQKAYDKNKGPIQRLFERAVKGIVEK